MKRMLNLQEKLMEVPQDFLNDAEEWLTNIVANQLAFQYQTTLKNIASSKGRGLSLSARTQAEIDNEEEYASTFDYLTGKYGDRRLLRVFKDGGTISKSFKLTDYKSKYGDLSRLKKSVTVGYKKQIMGQDGVYRPKTKKIDLYSIVLTRVLKDVTGEKELLHDEFLIFPFPSPSLEEDWLLVAGRNIEVIIKRAVRALLRNLEHEFIHLIQDVLFPDTITDPQYSSNRDKAYYPSPFEVNPWLVSSLENLEKDLEKTREPLTNSFLDKWILTQTYFKVLKEVDTALYKKMVKSFYQLVDERLEIK